VTKNLKDKMVLLSSDKKKDGTPSNKQVPKKLTGGVTVPPGCSP